MKFKGHFVKVPIIWAKILIMWMEKYINEKIQEILHMAFSLPFKSYHRRIEPQSNKLEYKNFKNKKQKINAKK